MLLVCSNPSLSKPRELVKMRPMTVLAATTTALLAGLIAAASALADTGMLATAADAPSVRVALGIASVIFAAALTRSRA